MNQKEYAGQFANAVYGLSKLFDFDLTRDEKFDILIMIEKVQDIYARLERERKSEFESIL